MHAEPRMDQTRCSGHSVSGTHGLADRLNARSHQMTLGRLNRVLRPPAHEMHIAHLIWLTTIVLWKDNGNMTLSFGVVQSTPHLLFVASMPPLKALANLC